MNGSVDETAKMASHGMPANIVFENRRRHRERCFDKLHRISHAEHLNAATRTHRSNQLGNPVRRRLALGNSGRRRGHQPGEPTDDGGHRGNGQLGRFVENEPLPRDVADVADESIEHRRRDENDVAIVVVGFKFANMLLAFHDVALELRE